MATSLRFVNELAYYVRIVRRPTPQHNVPTVTMKFMPKFVDESQYIFIEIIKTSKFY